MLLIAVAHVMLAYVSTVTNWRTWILIVVFPYIVALIGNRILRDNATFALPVVCVGASIMLCAFGMIQFLGIVTNPFYLPMTPVSLAIPALAIAVTLIGYGFGYRAQVKTKNV